MLTKGDITQEIYGDFINVTSDDAIKDLSTKILFTTKNKDALRLNNDLLDFIPGAATTYFSIDSHISDDEYFALDFLVEFVEPTIYFRITLSWIKVEESLWWWIFCIRFSRRVCWANNLFQDYLVMN